MFKCRHLPDGSTRRFFGKAAPNTLRLAVAKRLPRNPLRHSANPQLKNLNSTNSRRNLLNAISL